MERDAERCQRVADGCAEDRDEKCALSSKAIRKLAHKRRAYELRKREQSDEDAEKDRAMDISKRRRDQLVRKKKNRRKDWINDGKAKIIQKIGQINREEAVIFFKQITLFQSSSHNSLLRGNGIPRLERFRSSRNSGLIFFLERRYGHRCF